MEDIIKKSIPIYWGDHTSGKPVKCMVTPRTEFDGKKVKEDVLKHKGAIVELIALWEMNDKDPYPGEWALSTPISRDYLFVKLGVSWIASGDITVIDIPK